MTRIFTDCETILKLIVIFCGIKLFHGVFLIGFSNWIIHSRQSHLQKGWRGQETGENPEKITVDGKIERLIYQPSQKWTDQRESWKKKGDRKTQRETRRVGPDAKPCQTFLICKRYHIGFPRIFQRGYRNISNLSNDIVGGSRIVKTILMIREKSVRLMRLQI